ncbi:MAG: M42 family metallopeptidase [Candidatus Edwardsbacteria bacterium]
MQRTFELLKILSQASGASGFETKAALVAMEEFKKSCEEVTIDKMGSVIAFKKGQTEKNILLAAHLDEIGLMVTKIEKGGYLRFTEVGGFDQRILLAQEVTIHSKREMKGIIGSKPPHFQEKEEQEKVIKMEDLYIDVGLSQEEVEKSVRVGDPVTLNAPFVKMKDFGLGEKTIRCAGKSFDNRASVVVLIEAMEFLKEVSHNWNVYAVATVQEETIGLGAFTSTYKIHPDLGIAVDVTQGDMLGCAESETFPLTKGTTIAFGPNIHPRIFEGLIDVAKREEIPYQIEPCPGVTGTDAAVIQVVREGIPTGLISIPLRYMHTPVETLAVIDIERAARLLARFIEGLNGWKVEI